MLFDLLVFSLVTYIVFDLVAMSDFQELYLAWIRHFIIYFITPVSNITTRLIRVRVLKVYAFFVLYRLNLVMYDCRSNKFVRRLCCVLIELMFLCK